MKKKMENEVAVIIPVYNVESKLKKCIKSILRQSYDKFYLILVDDGSTDNSGKICDNFSLKDNRIYVIHQENKGSVEARKSGIYSDKAKEVKYLMFCDADDEMPLKAIEILVKNAEKYQADCVCGNMNRMIGRIFIPQFLIRFTPACFRGENVKVYCHKEIMSELYESCFGISNYPVNLVAKIYRRELVTNVAKDKAIVKFMGDDLSVTLKIMPNIKKLVIVSNIVYHYRVGGGTSKFMPYMLDDFLALYHYKNQLREYYKMDPKVKIYMDIELVNVIKSYFLMCKTVGSYNEKQMNQEIFKILRIPEMKEVVKSLNRISVRDTFMNLILDKNSEEINSYLNELCRKTRLKRRIKKILRVGR
jgi:glycosyltransferase involved in cell wall biosynthesis